VKGRQLLNVSEIEQDIACNENRSEQYRQVTEVLAGSQYDNLDKLKLVILYALRYEGDDRISTLQSALRECGLQQDKIDLVDAVLRYAGTAVRSCDLFSNKNLLARAKSNFKMVLGNVPNVYTQHQPYLTSVLEQLTKGKLREAEFPATAAYNPRER
jgi:vacuolar protein sorting-associated protein 45